MPAGRAAAAAAGSSETHADRGTANREEYENMKFDGQFYALTGFSNMFNSSSEVVTHDAARTIQLAAIPRIIAKDNTGGWTFVVLVFASR